MEFSIKIPSRKIIFRLDIQETRSKASKPDLAKAVRRQVIFRQVEEERAQTMAKHSPMLL